MSYFKVAMDFVLKNEGGFVNDSDDSGHITNLGVSLRQLHAYGLKYDWDKNGIVDAREIEHLTFEQAIDFYYNEFWLAAYDKLINETVAIYLFDMAVNMGPATAHKIAQNACNLFSGKRESLKVDGALGDNSLNALNHYQVLIMPTLRACREAEYKLIVQRNPKTEKFYAGWDKRVYSL